MYNLKKYGLVALVAAVVVTPLVAYSLGFNDATVDQVWGANSLTTAGNFSATATNLDLPANGAPSLPAGVRFGGPDGVAFDGSGNLWVAADSRVFLFLSPSSDTSLNALGTADTILTYKSVDTNAAGAVSLVNDADTLAIFRKIHVTTTDTDVVWISMLVVDSAAVGVRAGVAGGVAGLMIPGTLTSSTMLKETGTVRGVASDTLVDIIIGGRFAVNDGGNRVAPTQDLTASPSATNLHFPGGITAKESGNTITLFVADDSSAASNAVPGMNRVTGYNIYTLSSSIGTLLINGGVQTAANADSSADIIIGQVAATTGSASNGNDGDTGLNQPADVSWCNGQLFIADRGNRRVVVTDADSSIADTFGSPVQFAYGDTNSDRDDTFTFGFFTSDTSFLDVREIVCDGVSLAVSDTVEGFTGGTQGTSSDTSNVSGRVLVFTIGSDTTADDALGLTLATDINKAAGRSNELFSTLLDIAGYSGLIVVSDFENNRVIGFQGSFGSSTPTASTDGGTCLLEALFTGTSLEAALPVIRSARDASLGSTAGRFLTSAYYSVLGLAALVALAGGAALAFRRN